MPFEDVVIPFDKGAVNSRDPLLLDIGEMEICENAEYRPSDPAIWSAPGPAAFNSTPTAAQVDGLFAKFLTGSKIIVSTGTEWLSAPAGDTGEFTSFLSGLSPATSLRSAHFRDRLLVWDGVNRNRAIKSDLTSLTIGMLPNRVAPVIDTTAGAGSGYTITAGNRIDYWIEERVKDSTGLIIKRNITDLSLAEVTSAAVGGLTASRKLKRWFRELKELQEGGSISDLHQAQEDNVSMGLDFEIPDAIKQLKAILTEVVKPRIYRPDVVNSDATHWAAYASHVNGGYPIGAELGEVPIDTLYIDDIRTGTDPGLPGGEIFDTIPVSLAGVTVVMPKHGGPPVSTTGDMFGDQLVLNDVSNPGSIVWSYPRNIHAYPPLNRIFIPSTEGETVTLVKRVGNLLAIGTNRALWKMSWLPRPDESAFQREKGKEQVLGAQGVVGESAATIFSFGEGIRLAYVSFSGVHVSDLNAWDDIADDLDFDALVEKPYLHKSILIDNPSRYRLEWYFVPKGGTTISKVVHFYYQPFHAKQARGGGFRAKVTGPNDITLTSAVVGLINNEYRVLTFGSNGLVQTLGKGPQTNLFKIRSKSYALKGLGNEGALRSFEIHHRRASRSIVGSAAYIMHNPDQDPTVSSGTIDFGDPRASSVGLDGVAEELQLEISVFAPVEPVAVNVAVASFEFEGESEK